MIQLTIDSPTIQEMLKEFKSKCEKMTLDQLNDEYKKWEK